MDSGWSYEYTQDGRVTNLYLTYLDPEVYDRAAYEAAAEALLAECVFPGMTDEQIALSIHDALAARCSYDSTLTRVTEYDALVTGSAVCQGYAEAYMDLMNRAGVECVYVPSEGMDHGWNQVCLDGQWYHVDVTWDDPTPDKAGFVGHDRFLLSDEQALGQGYSGWESVHACASEWAGFWQEKDSAIIWTDAETCYLRRTTDGGYEILRRNGDAETVLYSFDLHYTGLGAQPGQQVHYYHEGLSLVENGLYFTDTHQVCRLDLTTGEVSAVYEHDVDAQGTVLVGSFCDGATLYLTTLDAEGNVGQMQVEL